MTLILILLLVLLLFGGGYGFRTHSISYGDPLGIIFFIILIVILFGLLGPYIGYRW